MKGHLSHPTGRMAMPQAGQEVLTSGPQGAQL